jgi:uncharacterized damage-inducible protein DinB
LFFVFNERGGTKLMASIEMKLLSTLYKEGRQTLEKDLQGLDVEALDWRGLDPAGVVTIGSHIVHIAGFDNLVRSALLGKDLAAVIQQPEWQTRYNPGFPRELSVASPTGNPLEYYLDVLRVETEETLRVITAVGSSAIDLDATTLFYEDGKEFQQTGLRPHNNLELLFYIPMHDRYHRGQITHQKYDYGVVQRQRMSK